MKTIRGLGAALALATTLAAQEPAPGGAPGTSGPAGALVHYGKWIVAAAAVTFTVLGAREHTNSNRLFTQLIDLCRADNATCELKPDGTYINPSPEELYQGSLHYDSRARLRLLAGQAALLLGVGLFLADIHHDNGPDNIPYHPAELIVEPRGAGARVGLRVRL